MGERREPAICKCGNEIFINPGSIQVMLCQECQEKLEPQDATAWHRTNDEERKQSEEQPAPEPLEIRDDREYWDPIFDAVELEDQQPQLCDGGCGRKLPKNGWMTNCNICPDCWELGKADYQPDRRPHRDLNRPDDWIEDSEVFADLPKQPQGFEEWIDQEFPAVDLFSWDDMEKAYNACAKQHRELVSLLESYIARYEKITGYGIDDERKIADIANALLQELPAALEKLNER